MKSVIIVLLGNGARNACWYLLTHRNIYWTGDWVLLSRQRNNPQAHGYRWAFHPGEGFKYRIHKENVVRVTKDIAHPWAAIKDREDKEIKEILRLSSSNPCKLCWYYSQWGCWPQECTSREYKCWGNLPEVRWPSPERERVLRSRGELGTQRGVTKVLGGSVQLPREWFKSTRHNGMFTQIIKWLFNIVNWLLQG